MSCHFLYSVPESYQIPHIQSVNLTHTHTPPRFLLVLARRDDRSPGWRQCGSEGASVQGNWGRRVDMVACALRVCVCVCVWLDGQDEVDLESEGRSNLMDDCDHALTIAVLTTRCRACRCLLWETLGRERHRSSSGMSTGSSPTTTRCVDAIQSLLTKR